MKRIELLAKEHQRAGETLPLIYTETGQIATSEEQLKEIAGIDPVLDVMLKHRQATKLLSTYARKMVPGKRVHGKFEYLMNTGRTSCNGGKKEVGGFNLQNLPKELDAASNHATTIRGCLPVSGGGLVIGAGDSRTFRSMPPSHPAGSSSSGLVNTRAVPSAAL
ncbi:MAG: hypothetical protein ACKOHG_06945 [Planctomycetia bacterium]